MTEEATVVVCGHHRVVLHITKKEWLESDDEFLALKYFRPAVSIMQARIGMEKGGICGTNE